jgi:hypothetical protein
MHKDMSGKRGDPKGKYFRESLAAAVACLDMHDDHAKMRVQANPPLQMRACMYPRLRLGYLMRDNC